MKSNIIFKCATLIFGLAVFAIAQDSVAFSLVQSVLANTSGYVLVVLGAIIAIKLIPLSWLHVSNVLDRGSRSGEIYSTERSKKNAIERLKKSKNSYARSIGNNTYKRRQSFEDFRDSSEFKNSKEFKDSRATFRKKGFNTDSDSNNKFEFKLVD